MCLPIDGGVCRIGVQVVVGIFEDIQSGLYVLTLTLCVPLVCLSQCEVVTRQL
jgi:hypothetical protein